jgi:hypothetical protein
MAVTAIPGEYVLLFLSKGLRITWLKKKQLQIIHD